MKKLLSALLGCLTAAFLPLVSLSAEDGSPQNSGTAVHEEETALDGESAGLETEDSEPPEDSKTELEIAEEKAAALNSELKIVEQKAEALDHQIKDLRTLLARAEKDKTNLQGILTQAGKNAETLNTQIVELEQLLAEAETQNDTLQTALAGAEQEKTLLQDRLAEAQGKFADLDAQVMDLQEILLDLEDRLAETENQNRMLQDILAETEWALIAAEWRTDSFLKELDIFKDEHALRMQGFPKYAEAREKRRKGDEAGGQQDFEDATAYYQDAYRLFGETIDLVRLEIAEERRIAEEQAAEKRRKAQEALKEYEKAQEILRQSYGKYPISQP